MVARSNPFPAASSYSLSDVADLVESASSIVHIVSNKLVEMAKACRKETDVGTRVMFTIQLVRGLFLAIDSLYGDAALHSRAASVLFA